MATATVSIAARAWAEAMGELQAAAERLRLMRNDVDDDEKAALDSVREHVLDAMAVLDMPLPEDE